ncbi:protein adenylyltransferase SelO, partial [uncultured Candidatus Thioglobus sp.]|uniref:protein adenylyltransferase SelO n=1 Tax=uncultured Candidatus Thioglobus sp. TaxID=655186 RepID=UPI0032B13860|nr:YdiU family protein [Candidatus Thioglobus sp.]MBT4315821.1 YdiU family protein [Candidatus Thioglobus sp.]MBT4553648.1 YdiU family protein [Candidatus Thioglobus sp.]MBT5286883.1 YdiU family protein [Candidatus Thioglobus sp.]
MAKNTLDFSSLGEEFFSPITTQPLNNTFLIHKNQALYDQLGLDFDEKTLLKIASGEQKFEGTQPIASIYAGHQFGHFVPQLGDGRSCLIGQVSGYELSLKGAGTTPYSRGADGRAVLRSSIREYLCSIAMKGLNIATTEALTLVSSDTEVYRENIEPGSIVMRVAPSHVRFGHFELFASRGQTAQVKQLADFVIEHYYPHCQGESRYVDFFNEVVKHTAVMIARWQAQGFSHGVMNTDNMSILGLTIDYGPFGFLETYNPKFVCNHSDHEGRYAFEQQPGIALWNLARLGDSLESLIDAKQSKAVLDNYQAYLVKAYSKLMRQKFGFIKKDDQDNVLIGQFFEVLYQNQKDYTNSLRQLSDIDQLSKDTDFTDWIELYHKRIDQDKSSDRVELMNSVNPKY